MESLTVNESGKLLYDLVKLTKNEQLAPKYFDYLAKLIVADMLQKHAETMIDQVLEKTINQMWQSLGVPSFDQVHKSFNTN